MNCLDIRGNRQSTAFVSQNLHDNKIKVPVRYKCTRKERSIKRFRSASLTYMTFSSPMLSMAGRRHSATLPGFSRRKVSETAKITVPRAILTHETGKEGQTFARYFYLFRVGWENLPLPRYCCVTSFLWAHCSSVHLRPEWSFIAPKY